MPLAVTCEFCGETLQVGQDGEESRPAGKDPHQQLRVHVMGCATTDQLIKHSRRHSWLLDMLAFRAAEPEQWKAKIHALIDAYLDKTI